VLGAVVFFVSYSSDVSLPGHFEICLPVYVLQALGYAPCICVILFIST